MKMKKTFILSGIVILLIAALILVNRDIYQFTCDTRLDRTFTPELDAKRDYLVFGPLTLKPGSYVLTPELTVEGGGSWIYLVDGEDQEFFTEYLPDGTKNPSYVFTISGGSKQVRVGVRYDPRYSTIQMTRLKITSDHVLYKDSLLRHLTLSVLWVVIAFWLTSRLCFPNILWKIFPWFSEPQNEVVLIILLGLTAVSCYPLFDPSTYVRGEDMFFHLTRIRGLADSLQAGYFPVRDQLYWLNNYGYGVGFYYPDLFLYFPAVLMLLGFSVLTAYKVFLVVCSFVSIAAVWVTANRIMKNRKAAYAAAIWMAFAAYRLSNVYYRGAVGETQAAPFYALIILGLYEIFYGDRSRWWVFAFGFWGMLSCHIISLTIAVVLTAVVLLTHIRRIFSDRGILFALLKSVGLAAGLSAYFWLPMFEQMRTNPGLKINSLIESGTRLNTTNYAFPVSNLLSRFKTWNFAWQADCVYPGWSLLIIPILRVAVWKKRDRSVKAADYMLVFSLLLLWMCTRAFPWKSNVFLPFVTRIQFAYRLLLPATVMLCICGGIYFAALLIERPAPVWLGLLALFCFFSTAFPVLQESVQNRTVDKRQFVMQDNRVSGAEYLPVGFDPAYTGVNADTVKISGNDIDFNILAHKRQRLTFTFTYELPEDYENVEFSVPLIYYTGYRATLTDLSGQIRDLPVGWDDKGLVSVGNEGLSKGTVTVSYEKTLIQRTGEDITLLTLLLAVLLHRKNRGGRKNKPERV